MRRKLLDLISLLPSLLLFLFPSFSFASVFINEIAWMGTNVSANDEWIELYNEGGTIDLSGWTLTDNVSLSISLSGSIAAGEYFLLERSDDDTVPGKPADIIYTGALGNDGRILTLTRNDSTVEDEVSGGSGWSSIGGNNTTKETAQRTTSGWTTGAATPKAQNVSYTPPSPPEDEDEEEEEDTETNDGNARKIAVKNDSPGERITLTPSKRTLSVSIEAGTAASLNQPLVLRAQPSGISEELMPSLTYLWNFGDGITESGKEVVHTFKYPGDYIIVLRASYKDFEDEVRAEVTILPITLEIMREEDGSVLLLNNAQYESDLSGYTLSGGSHQFFFPDRTILAANGAMRIPDVNFNSLLPRTPLMLTNPAYKLVAEYPTRTASQSFVPISVQSKGSIEVEDSEELPDEEVVPLELEAAVAEAIPESEGYGIFPYVGLLGLILVGGIALYTQRVA